MQIQNAILKLCSPQVHRLYIEVGWDIFDGHVVAARGNIGHFKATVGIYVFITIGIRDPTQRLQLDRRRYPLLARDGDVSFNLNAALQFDWTTTIQLNALNTRTREVDFRWSAVHRTSTIVVFEVQLITAGRQAPDGELHFRSSKIKGLHLPVI